MKIGLRKSVVVSLFLISGVISSVPLIAQPDQKLHVYVWDFSVSHDTLNKFAKVYRNDLETELIRLDKYIVLDRRRYDRIMAHQDMENDISDVRNLSSVSRDSLKANKADAVFFGELVFNIGSGKYKVNVTFQNLDGRILKQGDIIIDKAKIDDFEQSKIFIKDLLKVFYSKEVLAVKKEQFELVDEILRRYRARADEVSMRYMEVLGILLDTRDPIKYEDELVQMINAYNLVWSDLNDNRGKYLQDFGLYWSKDRLSEFSNIYTNIMDDFHERFIRTLGDFTKEIVDFRNDQSSNKREKKLKMEMVEKGIIKRAEDMRIELNSKIKPQINTFLDKLREEM